MAASCGTIVHLATHGTRYTRVRPLSTSKTRGLPLRRVAQVCRRIHSSDHNSTPGLGAPLVRVFWVCESRRAGEALHADQAGHEGAGACG